MINSLVGIHAFLGEAGVIAFIWAFVELLNPTPKRIRRAQIAAGFGVLLFFLSWFIGGYYYVSTYGASVKPVIKAGPAPWAHKIVTETKEHVFLLLPFMSMFTWGVLSQYKENIRSQKSARVALLVLIAVIVLIGFSMAGMGFLISSGYRSALEAASL